MISSSKIKFFIFSIFSFFFVVILLLGTGLFISYKESNERLKNMQNQAKTVKQYLESFPDDRREQIQKVCDVILNNLPKGYEEGIQHGMIGYHVPLSIYPQGYLDNKNVPLPYTSLASQKKPYGIISQ